MPKLGRELSVLSIPNAFVVSVRKERVEQEVLL